MIKNIGIFFSTDTGNTEKLAIMIQKELSTNIADIFDIAQSNKEDLEKYTKLLFGIPTWYYGEPQCDWDDFVPTLKTINFSNKIVGIFGCGDQEDYAEYFCDAMGILFNIVQQNGGNLIGKWPTEGYYFKYSKGLLSDKNHFVGLAIDEDRQAEMTALRVKKWVQQIRNEMNV